MYIDYPNEYDNYKRKDYAQDMDNLIGLLGEKEAKTSNKQMYKELTQKEVNHKLEDAVIGMRKDGQLIDQISKTLKMGRSQVGRIVRTYKLQQKKEKSQILPAMPGLDKENKKIDYIPTEEKNNSGMEVT